MYTVIEGGVTAATGFATASTAAGIKYKNRKDMALIYSQAPCVAADTFTKNVVKAAPVKWDQQVVGSGAKVQAVVVNSGIANACTGAEGFGYCKDTAVAAAKALDISEDGVLIGSTGVIGKQMPIDKLTAGIDVLAEKKNDTLENGTEAAKAIMTTDTCEKELAAVIEVGEEVKRLWCLVKPSGTIPRLVTWGWASQYSSVRASSSPSLRPGHSTICAWISIPAAMSSSRTSMPRTAFLPMRRRRTSGVTACIETFMGERFLEMTFSTSSSLILVNVTKLPCRNESR